VDNRPIGVFDSGVGGLTVLSEIIHLLPDENTVYFGDTLRFPYGPRDLNQVRHFVFKISEFLTEKNVKMLVVACNTSTAAALDDLKSNLQIPVIGVIEPGARTASNNTLSNRVGLIATKGTVESRAYEVAIKNINPQISLYSYAAPKLVELIEAGVLKGAELQQVISGYVDPLIKENIDVLILGCTHFPLIENQIILKYSSDFKVISSAVETAKDVKSTLEKLGMQNENTVTGRVPETKDAKSSSCVANSFCSAGDKRSTNFTSGANDTNGINDISGTRGINGEGNTGVRKGPERLYYETGNASKFLEVGRMFLGGEINEVVRVKLDMGL
jgi:glutamate racemase